MRLTARVAGRNDELYRQIYEAAGDIKPKNISIDTLSRAFAGNEIDRVQVYGSPITCRLSLRPLTARSRY